jgi:ribosomal protein S18 acetylase RimI-like enzyme
MQGDIAVRAARTGDEVALAGVAAVVQALHFAERPDVFKPVNPDGLREWFRAAINDPAKRIVVADVDGVVAGYAVVLDGERHESAFAAGRRWREVDQLAVLPSFQRRGVARALIEHVAATAVADGISALELNTWAFNRAAHEAFRRLGFRERSLRYERGLDEVQGGGMTGEALEALAARFAAADISRAEWTHQMHLIIGAWHVHRFGQQEALARLRAGIRRLNEANGVANTPTSGYHETITAAYVRLLAAALVEQAADLPLAARIAALLASPLAEKSALHRHYTPDLLRSARARAEWVPPDLQPLPLPDPLPHPRVAEV